MTIHIHKIVAEVGMTINSLFDPQIEANTDIVIDAIYFKGALASSGTIGAFQLSDGNGGFRNTNSYDDFSGGAVLVSGQGARLVNADVTGQLVLVADGTVSMLNPGGQVNFFSNGIFSIETGLLSLSNFADGQSTLSGTLENSPVAGNPTMWVPVKINGVDGFMPFWAPSI